MSKTSEVFNLVCQQALKLGTLGAKKLKTNMDEPHHKDQSGKLLGQIVDGHAQQRTVLDTEYQDIQQLFRHQFPSLTRQLLGHRFNTINKISHWVLPKGVDQAADEVLLLLSEFACHLASSEKVAEQTGCKSIVELKADMARSQRATRALTENNKIYAAAQGAISGLTGLLGAAVDLPLSVIFSLKTIYEIGHLYGFELDKHEEQQAVLQALSRADLGLIAEKQTILLGLRIISGVFKTGDFTPIQSMLSSHYTVEQFQNLITDESGAFKWPAFEWIKKIKGLHMAMPVLGGVVGALYSVKLIEDVAEQAEHFFSTARTYLNAHDDIQLTLAEAYVLGVQMQCAIEISTETKQLEVQQLQTEVDEASELDVQHQAASGLTTVLAAEGVATEETILQDQCLEQNVPKVDELEHNASQAVVKTAAVDAVSKNSRKPRTTTRKKTTNVASTEVEKTATTASSVKAKTAGTAKVSGKKTVVAKTKASSTATRKTPSSKAQSTATTSTKDNPPEIN